MSMWDERYGAEGFFYGTEPNDFLREAAARIPKEGPVLCLAEGEGRNAVFLARLGYDVTAVDQSPVGLEKARRLADESGVSLHTVVADLADYAIEPEAWAGIVSIWCHLPPPLRRSVHAACVRGLRPGGAFVLEAYTPRQLEYRTGGPPTAELMMSLDELRQELAGLVLEIAEETDREVHEGKGHDGRSAVVRVLGFKPPR